MDSMFNEQQQRVIAATGGHHLVLAPPGCGKTAVLAERIVYARQHGVPFDDMACLTFTNRAARGMKERITDRLGNAEGLDRLFVGNVHRFCLHFLFDQGIVPEHSTVIDTDISISIIADYLGEDELQVLDEARHRQRYSRIINLQHLMYQLCKAYPGELIIHRDAIDPGLLRQLCQAFLLDYTRQGIVQLYQQVDHYRSEHTQMNADAHQLLQQLYAARQYELYKWANDLLDFEDLLLFTYDVLKADADGLAHRYRWLQIDEVQDLNPLQMAIVDMFSTPDATVVCLGDAQQAIFSFMGAQTDTLNMLSRRCGPEHVYSFYQNYRSPQYLLDIFNRYAQWKLGIDPSLLPTTSNQRQRSPGDVDLLEAPTNIDEANMVARLVKRLYQDYPDETVAVVVAFNSDADEVSAALGQVPHFKISGADFFAAPPVRLLLSHLGVIAMEHDFISWSTILSGLHVYASNSSARQTVRAMMQLAISPADLLLYEDTTYVAEYVKTYEQRDMVVFDTETTGLDVFLDDVVQIAAIRVRQGRIVDRLNVFIETSRPIPPMLGEVVNPLVDEYGRHEHLPPAQALTRFVEFAKGCAILGHNTTYDYQILEHNMQRYAPQLSMYSLWPDYMDTLKLARLLHPRQKSYKLRDLLMQLGLEGQNTHMADDDIMATLSLAVHCYELGRSIMGRQLEFLSRHRQKAQQFRNVYAPLFLHTRSLLYKASSGPVLAQELRYAYDYLLSQKLIAPLPKLHHIIKYVEVDMLLTDAHGKCSEGSDSLATQLTRHYSDLCTMKEADLCGSASMDERVFVSTVHKAKGLEFDSVIVYDAVDGKYPSVFAKYEAVGGEEARKFYVAISRARRRLIISYCHNAVSRWGSWHAKVLTPFMNPIGSMFQPF